VKITAAVAIMVWLATFMVGAFVGRSLVRARTRAKLDELAKAYEIPVAELQQIAAMVDKL
jgi:hypothetical protein